MEDVHHPFGGSVFELHINVDEYKIQGRKTLLCWVYDKSSSNSSSVSVVVSVVCAKGAVQECMDMAAAWAYKDGEARETRAGHICGNG